MADAMMAAVGVPVTAIPEGLPGIDLFFQSCSVKVIYFNDPKIHRVLRRFKHDNHFHVTIFG